MCADSPGRHSCGQLLPYILLSMIMFALHGLCSLVFARQSLDPNSAASSLKLNRKDAAALAMVRLVLSHRHKRVPTTWFPGCSSQFSIHPWCPWVMISRWCWLRVAQCSTTLTVSGLWFSIAMLVHVCVSDISQGCHPAILYTASLFLNFRQLASVWRHWIIQLSTSTRPCKTPDVVWNRRENLRSSCLDAPVFRWRSSIRLSRMSCILLLHTAFLLVQISYNIHRSETGNTGYYFILHSSL